MGPESPRSAGLGIALFAILKASHSMVESATQPGGASHLVCKMLGKPQLEAPNSLRKK